MINLLKCRSILPYIPNESQKVLSEAGAGIALHFEFSYSGDVIPVGICQHASKHTTSRDGCGGQEFRYRRIRWWEFGVCVWIFGLDPELSALDVDGGVHVTNGNCTALRIQESKGG